MSDRIYSPSKTIIAINFAIAILIIAVSFRRYENYLHLSQLLNGPTVKFSIPDYLEASSSLLAVAAICVLGAIMEMKRFKFAWALNFLIPACFLILLVFQFITHHDPGRSSEAAEAKAVFLLLVIPLLLISSLYGFIYFKRYKNEKRELASNEVRQ